MRSQKEKRKVVETTFLFLENTSVNNNKKNVADIRTVKAIPVRFQMEMRNMLLETGGYVILVINWQNDLVELCSSFCVI